MELLSTINGHSDLVRLNGDQRQQLCREIREYLVSSVSETGGHLASNLGVVELSVALETVFDTDVDRLVFDVGHQSYVHKMLTGRKADFSTLRQFGGMAGFPKPAESKADAFTAGHASSSVSIALGMARARTLQGDDYKVIALVGDGAATGGMIYEGLNDAAVSNEPLIVILNDNAMSIDHNVGGMASHLRNLRVKDKYLGMKKRYKSFLTKIPGGKALHKFTSGIKDRIRRALIPSNIFENMGFTYLGPVDGHDTERLIHLLQNAVDRNRPVLLHVFTQKGRGYEPAQEHPKLFHGIGKFDKVSGRPLKAPAETFSDVFGNTMADLAKKNEKLCAITAAMPGGTGLLPFKEKFPTRLFDVGIAEEHAVSMAGGLAKQGMIPVVAIYSTFLQRAYDMILQDICMQKLHVVFAVDRAGLVGEDGETHHGVFDVGFLRQAPGMKILCPATKAELSQMLCWAVEEQNGPVAIRYPRGSETIGDTIPLWEKEGVVCYREGKDVTILTYGTLIAEAVKAGDILAENGVEATVLRLQRVDRLPVKTIIEGMSHCRKMVVMEETCAHSGINEALSMELPSCDVHGIDLGHRYVTHGSVQELYRFCGLDGQSVADYVLEELK